MSSLGPSEGAQGWQPSPSVDIWLEPPQGRQNIEKFMYVHTNPGTHGS
jgi:hypothetical protein